MNKNLHLAIWFIGIAVGGVAVAQLFIWGGRPALVVAFTLSVLAVVVLEWLASKEPRGNVEDVEALKQELAKKVELVEDQAKLLGFLRGECDAYRKDRDEAWRREALLKKQVRELRGRAEYWRAKYKALTNAETDPDDTEIVITPNTSQE